MAMLPTAGMPSNPVFKLLAGAAAARHGRPNAHDLDFAGDHVGAAQLWLHRHPAAQAEGNIPAFVIHDLAAAAQHAQHGASAPAPQMPLAPQAPTPPPPVPIPADVSNGFKNPGPYVPTDVRNGFRAPAPGIGWFGPGGGGIAPPPQPEPQRQRIGWFGPHGGGIATLPPGEVDGGLPIPNPNLTNGVKPMGRQSLLARAAAGGY